MIGDIDKIKKYVRAANYLTVTQIYLKDNFLLERPLTADDIKPRLFGHWGTCPGINYVYGHLNYLVKKHQQSAMFILGPGHGFPGLQSNLFLEGTLEKYYPQAPLDANGIAYVSKMFSWPHGFQSHSSPEAPGVIVEGGELGYSLATAYGAILDNPDLLAVCLIGDGEAETGSIATAWHINKFIDPSINGAVLPILHLNGLKISGPTIFGRMSDEELTALFTGYGYEPFFADENYEKMLDVMEVCYQRIYTIQQNARNGKKTVSPRFPMIVLRTKKGWTAPKEHNGQKLEGTIAAHQVVMPNIRKNADEVQELENWLRSYKFDELFDKENGFDQDILEIIPRGLEIGNNNHGFGGRIYKPLNLPKAKSLEQQLTLPGQPKSYSMKRAGEYLREVFRLNESTKNFRLFSPDETYSNRLDDIFEVTSRAFMWPMEESDKHMTTTGRVMEMLSEHNLHGLAQGYILTGRHAVLATYEAFAQIFSSMSQQYMKFLNFARQKKWRGDISSMNYILTSSAWRQEHNGYSHQNPGFISSLLDKHHDFIKVYFPVDDNSMVACLTEALSSKNQINTIVSGKTIEPRWLTLSQAQQSLHDGLSIWDFASDEDPDIVVSGIGDYMTKEALSAIDMVKKDAKEIRIRFVNILRLSAACSCEDEYHPQVPNAKKYFTADKPVIVTFHGYPEVMKAILFDVPKPERFSVHGYTEEGATTTPFDMQVRNDTSRYHIAIEIVERSVEKGVYNKEKGEQLIKKYKQTLVDHEQYIREHGVDMEEVEQWEWGKVYTVPVADNMNVQANILKNVRTIGIVGLSDKPERYSHIVATYLQSKGYRIIPINPHVSEVLGEKSYPDILSVPQNIKIDVVTMYRKSDEVFHHVQEAVQRGDVKTIWLPEGVENEEAEKFAAVHGLTAIVNFCIMKSHQKNVRVVS